MRFLTEDKALKKIQRLGHPRIHTCKKVEKRTPGQNPEDWTSKACSNQEKIHARVIMDGNFGWSNCSDE